MWCSIPDISSQGLLDAALGYWSSRLSILSALCFTVFSFLCLHSLLSGSSFLCPLFSVHGFKSNQSHNFSLPLPPSSNHLLLFAWSSLSPRHHQQLIGSGHLSSRELHQPFTVGLLFQLHCEMSHPPSQRSNRTSNPYRSRCNPLSSPVLSLSAFSAVRSRAPRSNTIHSFQAVDLLDHQHAMSGGFLSHLPATHQGLNGITRFQPNPLTTQGCTQ